MKDESARLKPGPPSRDTDGLNKGRGIWRYKLEIDGKWREFSAKTQDYRRWQLSGAFWPTTNEAGRMPIMQPAGSSS